MTAVRCPVFDAASRNLEEGLRLLQVIEIVVSTFLKSDRTRQKESPEFDSETKKDIGLIAKISEFRSFLREFNGLERRMPQIDFGVIDLTL
ncbi:hypothetical protein ELH67_15955 [Rhizobium ruizarguesonis]|uniref:hypothetical protein n=1 Tax=Rhizobium ruizarguesonis TaxID=2081791 RepID=UPI00103242CE|nr:hypothetical protein [Rhizobium ruizarguesonis]TAZ95943.1 hypothetical protein ELH67_15955 [Rhizobium ruizarguesonis]